MNTILDQDQAYSKEITRDFFKNVYGYMFGGLMISGLIAYTYGTPEFFAEHFLKADGTGISPLFYVVSFAPVGLGLLIQMMYQRLSFGLLLLLFAVFSGLMGLEFKHCAFGIFRTRCSGDIFCYCRCFWWNGNIGLYNSNGFNQVWKSNVYGVHRYFYCWNCKHVDWK